MFNSLTLNIWSFIIDAKKKKDDVVIHTGLPPKVEGQLRCHCCLSVSQVKWTCPSPPDVTHVRVRWWGEEGEGAIFRFALIYCYRSQL